MAANNGGAFEQVYSAIAQNNPLLDKPLKFVKSIFLPDGKGGNPESKYAYGFGSMKHRKVIDQVGGIQITVSDQPEDNQVRIALGIYRRDPQGRARRASPVPEKDKRPEFDYSGMEMVLRSVKTGVGTQTEIYEAIIVQEYFVDPISSKHARRAIDATLEPLIRELASKINPPGGISTQEIKHTKDLES